jgi:hypothetical protein
VKIIPIFNTQIFLKLKIQLFFSENCVYLLASRVYLLPVVVVNIGIFLRLDCIQNSGSEEIKYDVAGLPETSEFLVLVK